MRDKYDLILIDIMGTVNTAGFDSIFLTKIDYVIVPTLVDYEDTVSNMDFIKSVLFPLKMGRYTKEFLQRKNADEKTAVSEYKRGAFKKYSSLKDFAVLFNRIENNKLGDRKIAEEMKIALNKMNVSTFDTILYKRKKYSKIHIQHYSAGLKSTIFPTYDTFISRLVEEFIKYIKL